MKIFLCTCAVLLLALINVPAQAADITGKWTAEVAGPNGDSFQLSFSFKQDGATLSGTVEGPQGGAIAISDGKVDGDKVSFKVSFNGITIFHDGKINSSGDEIKLNSKSDTGEFPTSDMTLKRAK